MVNALILYKKEFGVVCYIVFFEKVFIITLVKMDRQDYPIMALGGRFYKKNLIAIGQFTRKGELKRLFGLADKMKKSVEKREVRDDLKGFCIAELFYQPSTRTFTSFLAAAQRMGASYVIPIPGMSAYSSAVKGESLADTIRTIEQTTAADLIILRHPEDNSSAMAAYFSRVPIINAGAGKIEHPTQALLDLYTIRQELGRTNGLTVTFLGDLKYGRTVKSLSKLLALADGKTKMVMVSPPSLRLPKDDLNYLIKNKVKVKETADLKTVLAKTDVLYATRIQKEWFEAEGRMDEYERLKGKYDINNKIMKLAKKKMVLMHPLPRVGEIAYEVDDDPRAAYFRQMRNGLYIRMALLRLILKKEN